MYTYTFDLTQIARGLLLEALFFTEPVTPTHSHSHTLTLTQSCKCNRSETFFVGWELSWTPPTNHNSLFQPIPSCHVTDNTKKPFCASTDI
ncbi:hypothetical protein GBA52_028574 [Prunus armeniaca]|nr:hypothetical protein GBA52_028574 [Prunus armeniaca]